MSYPIVIVTYGRASLEKQLTWNYLPQSLRDRVIFAVRAEEADFFSKLGKIFILPDTCVNLATTCQAIWDQFHDKHEYLYLNTGT
jgi:hypothetical protein